MCVCEPNEKGHQAVSFISNVLSQCIYEPIEIVSFVFGWLSILFWFLAHFPQVRVTFILKTSQGLSLPFVCLWIFADGMNLVAGIFTGQLFTSLVLYAYCTCMDILFLIQYLIFFKRTKRLMQAAGLTDKNNKKKNGKKRNRDKKDSLSYNSKFSADVETNDTEINLVKNISTVKKESASTPSESSSSNSSSSSSSSSSTKLSSNNSSVDSEELEKKITEGKFDNVKEGSNHSGSGSTRNSLVNNRRSSFMNELRRQRGSIFSSSVIGGSAIKDLLRERRTTMILAQKKAQAKANKVMLGENPAEIELSEEKNQEVSAKDLTKMSAKTIVQVVFYILLILLVLAFAALWVDAKNSVNPQPCVESTTSHAVFVFGYVVAWLCCAAYVAASPISIIHIVRAKSADDKSPVFFGSCAIGNTFYLLSMFLSPLNNGIWLRRLPFLISTTISTTFYYIDMAFIAYYQHKSSVKKKKLSLELSYGSNPNISRGGSIMEDNNTGGEDVPQLTEDTETSIMEVNV